MESPIKVLVAIDLTEMDHVLIEYVTLFINTLQTGSVVFVHVHGTGTSDSFFGKSRAPENPAVISKISQEVRSRVQAIVKGESFLVDA